MKLKSLIASVLTLTTIGLTLPTVAGVPGLSPFPQHPQPVPSLHPVELLQTPPSSSPANISQQFPSLSSLAANSADPFIVLVNGSGDCCAYLMKAELQRRLSQNRRTTKIWTTSYASFENGSKTNQVAGGISTDRDNRFIPEAKAILNNIPPSRPIVLIGHSYGGDSILKVLPLIERQIQLVVVIDPVGTSGLRGNTITNKVPANVKYFMNRWQENGFTGDNI